MFSTGHSIRSLARFFSALLSLSLPATASGTYLLHIDGSGRAFSGTSSIQDAIDAALEGDVIFVAPPFGYFPSKIVGKSLTLMALPHANIALNGVLEISGLAAGQCVVVSGFSMGACWIHDNAGAVRLQYMSVLGGGGLASQYCPGGPGQFATRIANSSDVSLYYCTLKGDEGYPDWYLPVPGAGGDGGHGLSISSSKVAAYDCILQGGLGGESYSCAGNGGIGCAVDASSFAFFSGCVILAGEGGLAYADIGGPGGAGGTGLTGNGTVHHVATSFVGAAGGDGQCGLGYPCTGPAGVGLSFNGTLVAHDYAPTVLFGDGLQASGSPWDHVLDGPIGEHVFVTGSSSTVLRWVPAWESVRLLPFPFFVPIDSVLLIGPQQHAQYALTDLAGQAFRRYSMQALCIDAGGHKRLSNPLELLHLNRAVGPDCNGNGVNDIVEIYEGTALDSNNNLVPDGCPGG